MSLEKKYFLLSILAGLVFSVLGNVITPIFQQNRTALIILLFVGGIFIISMLYQEIRTWLAKKSLISKKKRISELETELENFVKVSDEVSRNTNRFILLVVQKFIMPFLVLLFCLFSRISIGSIFTVLLGPSDANISDFYASIEAVFLSLLIIEFTRRSSAGWSFINKVIHPEKYTQRLKGEIEWLESRTNMHQEASSKKS